MNEGSRGTILNAGNRERLSLPASCSTIRPGELSRVEWRDVYVGGDMKRCLGRFQNRKQGGTVL